MIPDERKAALAVAARSAGAADCRDLLDALGLLSLKPKRPEQPPSDPTRRGPRVHHGHGVIGRYQQGCRCDACKKAATAVSREWRARVRKDPDAADRAGHARASTYKNYACRCDPCREAHALAVAERRRRRAARKAVDA